MESITNKNYIKKSQQPQPKIIQTLFIVDNKRQYLFDVNQNITIKKLKQMIVAAAELNKVGLRIFHDGTEYTNYDINSLDQLFPNLQKVIFTLQYSYGQVEDLEEIIDLKLLQYCNLHDNKYPYFYCFTCGKSICTDCIKSGEHNNHDIKEKYDYLQESRNLVELLFKDLKDMFKNVKGGNEESVEELKAKVSMQFFPKLVQMVREIEQKMLNLIVFFLEKEKGNFKTIENNINLLKSHCQEGLDKLKNEIVIEDIMIDENVFLTFHQKFKEIGKEKEKFKDDIEKYKKFSENLFIIKSIIEKTYQEIYDFLLKYLKEAEFEDIKNKIDSENINVVDKGKIFDVLLSNVKRRTGSIIREPRKTYLPPLTNEFIMEEDEEEINNQNSDQNQNLKTNQFPKQNENRKINFLLTSTQKKKIDNNNIPNTMLNTSNISRDNNYSNLNNENYNQNNNLNDDQYNSNMNNNENYIYQDKTYNNLAGRNQYGNLEEDNNGNSKDVKQTTKTILKSTNPAPIITNHTFNVNQTSNTDSNFNYQVNNKNDSEYGNNNNSNISYKNSNYVQSNYYLRSRNKNMLPEKEEVQTQGIYEEEEIKEEYKGPVFQIVCNIVPSKNQIILYNIEKDIIIRKNIEFSKFVGISRFLEESAWANNNNKLYILGGIDDFGQSTKIFLEYDPYKNIIKRLPDSKYAHSRHSIYAYNNEIYVIGGDRLECEKYDIINSEWKTLPNLAFKQIYPVLYVHKDILYSFFGIDENIRKTDNAQKLNLKNNRSKWMKLTYNRNGCDLCMYGCGVAHIDDNCILFLGGMDENGIRDETIQFNFSNLTAYATNYVLDQKAYFKDSVLLRLSSKNYGNFSIDDKNPFLKIYLK